MKKNPYRTEHIIDCPNCGCTVKVFCQLKRGGYSQTTLNCPKCSCFAGWITSSPGFELERCITVVMDEVSGY